ncbi:MAG: helix-turn-helix transcriptional regulator [Rhodospirillaceae bacterium]|jgi:phage repressor protein C with HTH and peptisase S24 domain|nr:helix-turn-helix transcriptional regulator [Rhodospirillaceae bacterium]MBT6137722.1 helix-turn-helix transcriptional regulator [Rhodospirillaceae bacterium]
METVRKRILELIAHRDPPTDLKKASLICGKNHAYLHQFINRGTPKRLPEEVRHTLAHHLGVDESVLRMEVTLPPYAIPHPDSPRASGLSDAGAEASPPGFIAIPEVRVASVRGSVSQYEPKGDVWYFSNDWIRHSLAARPEDLKVVAIEGDSMEPSLLTGDRVIIDVSRRTPTPPGMFVLHDGVGLVAKQLEFIPNSEPPTILVRAVNPAYQAYERAMEDLNVIGRIVWLSRRL